MRYVKKTNVSGGMLVDQDLACQLLVVFGPPLVIAAYWFGKQGMYLPTMDWIMLIVALAVGMVGIWLPIPRPLVRRIIATVLYVPSMTAALFFGLLIFECSRGNCL